MKQWTIISIGLCLASSALARPVTGPRGKDGSETVVVPSGSFVMGDDHGTAESRPQRTVTVAAFAIDKFEVSNAQYKVFLQWVKEHGDQDVRHAAQPAGKDHTPRFWKSFRPTLLTRTGMAKLQPFDDETFRHDDHPVVGIDWFDAYAYAHWAGKRLPTEAEWEKAARGPEGTIWPWGNQWRFEACNSGGYQQRGPDAKPGRGTPFIYSAPVDSFASGDSVYGCRNMAGNVAEWVGESPQAGLMRVVKGGGSDSYPSTVAAAARRLYPANFRYFSIGFRCATDAPSPPNGK